MASTRGTSTTTDNHLEIELKRDSGRGKTSLDEDAESGEVVIDSKTPGPTDLFASVMYAMGVLCHDNAVHAKLDKHLIWILSKGFNL